jgi:glutamine transport system permease protein
MAKYVKVLAVLAALALIMVAAVGCTTGTTTEAPRVIKGVADLKSGDKIGVQSGTSGEAWATENLKSKGMVIVPFADVLTAFNALQSGDVIGVINDYPVSKDVAKDPARGLDVVEVISTDEGYGLAVQKGNKAMLDALSWGIDEVVKSGEYVTIYKTWFMGVEPSWEPTPSGVAKPAEIKTLTPGKIIVGSDTTYPPFESVDTTTSQIVGFDVDLMNAIAKKLGMTAEFKTYNFDALVAGAQAGTEYDMIASGMTSTGQKGIERRTALDFTEPYYMSDQSLTVVKPK